MGDWTSSIDAWLRNTCRADWQRVMSSASFTLLTNEQPGTPTFNSRTIMSSTSTRVPMMVRQKVRSRRKQRVNCKDDPEERYETLTHTFQNNLHVSQEQATRRNKSLRSHEHAITSGNPPPTSKHLKELRRRTSSHKNTPKPAHVFRNKFHISYSERRNNTEPTNTR